LKNYITEYIIYNDRTLKDEVVDILWRKEDIYSLAIQGNVISLSPLLGRGLGVG
jgi:hypothetical protein